MFKYFIGILPVLVISLICTNAIADQSSGWETNTNIRINASTLNLDSTAWFDVQRRNNWNKDNEHYSEHWRFELADTSEYKLFKYGVRYRYINNNNLVEHRPQIYITPQTTVFDNNVVFSLRNQLAYRIRDSADDGFRFRIRPQIAYTIYDDGTNQLVPFVSDEIGYDFTDGDWGANKVAICGSRKHSRYKLTPYFEYGIDIPSGHKNESRWGVQARVTF